MENKDAIVKQVARCLRMTSVGKNVIEGEYYNDGETEEALLYMKSGLSDKTEVRHVNITGCSGLTIMEDMIDVLKYRAQKGGKHEVQDLQALRRASGLRRALRLRGAGKAAGERRKEPFSETSGPSRTFYRLDREKPENRVKYGALPKSEAPRLP